ncbi:hypothetical protein HK098_004493 [Nowakowskiella sp. JEL0407]|nr:hypothetical protein HK098_004493 [Nowakowskiella sp. JEL0407]
MDTTIESSVCPVNMVSLSTSNSVIDVGATDVNRNVSVLKSTDDASIHAAILSAPTTEQEIRTAQSQKTTLFYNSLRQECQLIEDHMRVSELDVLRKEEDAFLAIKFEHEISRMQNLQATEVKERKLAFEKLLQSRAIRQQAKKAQKQMFRDIKKRDSTITEQEDSAKAMEKIQEQLSDRSKMFERQIAFVEAKHEKQRKQLLAAQERKLSAEKTLHDLETKHLKSELRSTLQKNFQGRINHQKALDKRMMDHQRELQLLELRQLKERADVEEKSFEEIQSMKIIHNSRLLEMQSQHLSELHAEKDRLYEVRQQYKVAALDAKYASDMKRLTQNHRAQMRAMRQMHAQIIKQRKVNASSGKTGRSDSTSSLSQPSGLAQQQNGLQQQSPGKPRPLGVSRTASRVVSRQGSNESISHLDDDERMSEAAESNSRLSVTASERGLNLQSRLSTRLAGQPKILQEDADGEELQSPEINGVQEAIRKLQTRQREDLATLNRTQKEEADKLLAQWQTRAKELETEQSSEMAQVKETHEREINEMLIAQEREIQMESVVHDVEMKMLLERRLLNSVLNTVLDAIITIDPIGTIKRFNAAAEKMFGYKHSEIIDHNVRELMPEYLSVQHDTFLKNYMTTGAKKVIGIGRRAFGLRKDKTTFPVHLSVSEVKDDTLHLFTGIVRDLTDEIKLEQQQEEKTKNNELELTMLLSKLAESKSKSQKYLSAMVPLPVSRDLLAGKTPEPQAFESCTILCADVVGFSGLSSRITPEQTVQFLNELHHAFDKVILQYDAYKVESVGDRYVVASGLPNPNGNAHSGIIATIAFHLLYIASRFKMDHDPNAKLQIRIGINTGPVVAGVVGKKVPRYQLFGDTLAIASKMETTSEAMGIQITESTYESLQKQGDYQMNLHGEIEIKMRKFPFPTPGSSYRMLNSQNDAESQGDLAEMDLDAETSSKDGKITKNGPGNVGSLLELSILRKTNNSRRSSITSLISSVRGTSRLAPSKSKLNPTNNKSDQQQSRRSSIISFQNSRNSRTGGTYDEEEASASPEANEFLHRYHPSRLLKDEKEIALLLRLARALVLFGAPSYRVETRITTAAEYLGVPLSIIILPNLLLVAFGNGTSRHPSQTTFIPLSQGFEIGKLADVDRVARKCLELVVNPGNGSTFPEPLKYIEENQSCLSLSPSLRSDAELPPYLSGLKRSYLETSEYSAISPNIQTENPTLQRITPTSLIHTPIKEEKENLIPDSTTDTIPWYRRLFQWRKSTQEPKAEPKKNYDAELEALLHALDDIVSETKLSTDSITIHKIRNILKSAPIQTMANGIQSALLCVVVQNGTPADAVAAFCLGSFANILVTVLEYVGISGIADVIISFIISFLARLVQTGRSWNKINSWWWMNISPGELVISLWNNNETNSTFKASTAMYNDVQRPAILSGVDIIAPNICHSVVSMMSVVILLPGFMMTIGMLEIGQGNSIAGSIRMLLSSVRALRLGFGLAMGSRFAHHISPSVQSVVFFESKVNEFVNLANAAASKLLDSIAANTSIPELTGELSFNNSTIDQSLSDTQKILFSFGPDGWADVIFNYLTIPEKRSSTVLVGDYEDWTVCFSKVRGSKSPVHYWMNDSLRLPLFIPLVLCILILLRAHPKQWPLMLFVSGVSYSVSLIVGSQYNADAGALVASFILGIVANIIARIKNDIAIGYILAGMFWLAPGSIGVSAAARSIAESTSSSTTMEASAGAATFGITMITRAMSIAVGLL